jgi:carbamoyl-phosphate synthase small subunit
MNGLLALEDGSVFHGVPFGAPGTVVGEVCFNTSMTGYQEILTDPSYKGQIVTLTYPEIGNYGVNPEDVESYQPHVSGLITRELSPVASNWRSAEPLSDYMARHKIPGLTRLDTRALTKKLRVTGALKGVLTTEPMSPEQAVQKAREWTGLVGVDYVKEVTCREPYHWESKGIASERWVDGHEAAAQPPKNALPPSRNCIVAFDFGVKYNILRRLRQHGFDIQVVPARTSAQEVLALNPDGVFLSNGPGDPAALDYAHETVRELIGKKPIFGICLGHQILCHAMGGKTFKLKFGHRGGNQPVKDLLNGKVSITSQNHGFAVDPASLPADVEVTHINLNDGTCEGLRHRKHPVFSVQYHPEAAPGPHDATYFFEEFAKVIDQSKQKR